MQIGLYIIALYVGGAIALGAIAFAYKSHLRAQSKRRRHLRRVANSSR
jgi:hypothetical protein